jgi:hypothetical protein
LKSSRRAAQDAEKTIPSSSTLSAPLRDIFPVPRPKKISLTLAADRI